MLNKLKTFPQNFNKKKDGGHLKDSVSSTEGHETKNWKRLKITGLVFIIAFSFFSIIFIILHLLTLFLLEKANNVAIYLDQNLKEFNISIGENNISGYSITIGSGTYYLTKDLENLKPEKNEICIIVSETGSKSDSNPSKKYETIDLFTDSSIQKFVSAKIPFDYMEYVPANLVQINSPYISGNQYLRQEARDSLVALGREFYENFGRKLGVVSAYRSYQYQFQVKQGCGDTWCAKPGYSEHQTGLVVDIFEASNEGNWRTTPSLQKYYQWFVENAHKYGWHNTYQKGVAVDTYEVEPWHWRYLGVPLATYLYESDLTIAEYYDLLNEK